MFMMFYSSSPLFFEKYKILIVTAIWTDYIEMKSAWKPQLTISQGSTITFVVGWIICKCMFLWAGICVSMCAYIRINLEWGILKMWLFLNIRHQLRGEGWLRKHPTDLTCIKESQVLDKVMSVTIFTIDRSNASAKQLQCLCLDNIRH